MKTNLFLTLIIISLMSCEKDAEIIKKELVTVSSYYEDVGDYPYPVSYEDTYLHKATALFYFFDADQIKSGIIEEHFYAKDFTSNEFSHIDTETEKLLDSINSIKLENGTIVEALDLSFTDDPAATLLINYGLAIEDGSDWNDASSRQIYLPPGEYLIVTYALFDLGKDIDNKYSYKYITVSNQNGNQYVSILFPDDDQHKGYFDWITPTKISY